MSDGKHKWGTKRVGWAGGLSELISVCDRCGVVFSKILGRIPRDAFNNDPKTTFNWIDKKYPCISDEEYSFRKNYKTNG